MTDPRMSAKDRFVILVENHPSIGQECSICHQPMKEGDIPTVIGDGPDDYFMSRPFAPRGVDFRNAPTTIAHESCAYPEGES